MRQQSQSKSSEREGSVRRGCASWAMRNVRATATLQTAGCGGSSYSWRRVPERQMKLKWSSKDTDRSRREHSGTADLWKKLRIFLLSPREQRGADHSVFRESGACRLMRSEEHTSELQ